MVSAKSDKEYIAKLLTQAKEDFAKHELRDASDGRWVIQARDKKGHWTSIYAAEIISLRFGALLVHGDIDHVMFSCYSDDNNHVHKLHWIGSSDLSYYVKQKASIGMGDRARAAIEHQEASVWLYHAHLYVEGINVEEGEEVSDWLRDAIERVEAGQPLEEVLTTLPGWEASEIGVTGWGSVPSPRLIYAYAAVQRAIELIDATASGKVGT